MNVHVLERLAFVAEVCQEKKEKKRARSNCKALYAYKYVLLQAELGDYAMGLCSSNAKMGHRKEIEWTLLDTPPLRGYPPTLSGYLPTPLQI